MLGDHRTLSPALLRRLGRILNNFAVAKGDPAPRVPGDVCVVSDEHYGDTLGIQGIEEFENLRRGLSIERARWFVGQQEVWVIDERASDGHSLLLAA